MLGFVARKCELLSLNTCKTLSVSLVSSILEYASVLWSPDRQNSSDTVKTAKYKFLQFAAYKPNINIKNCHKIDVRKHSELDSLVRRKVVADVWFL